jgi:6-pyruvoyltetrahydropterin/6-carboxytetrahydropterin synthase
MIIRKKFSVESSHVVRNCSSDRCKYSIHGHSAEIEVFLEATQLDNAMMVYDFGLMKGAIKDFIDSFDHTHMMWNKESDEYKNFFKKTNERWVELPISPSAEGLAIFFLHWISKILNRTRFNNGEDKSMFVHSVRYHETRTGYAEAFMSDDSWMSDKYNLDDVLFSEGIMKDWKNPNMIDEMVHNEDQTEFVFINPKVRMQV